MRNTVLLLASIASLVAAPIAASAQGLGSSRASSGRQAQQAGQREIPTCTRRLGSIAIVEPDNAWWRDYNLGSPEAIIRLFIQRSGCFTIVNRGSGLASRNIERALADQGELQQNSNIGRGQIRAADYFLVPDLITQNANSGGNALGGVLGGFLGRSTVGAIAGGINIRRKEANVTLALVNARTTEEERVEEGYYRKTDIGFGGGAGAGWWGGLAGAGGSGYQNTEIGQVIVLAYLDAYTRLVTQLGGLPADASAAAPQAR